MGTGQRCTHKLTTISLNMQGRVRVVSKNILLGRGNSRSYYTPSQGRAQNPGSSVAMSQMIERALEAEREQHRAQMAREREEITA
jgi:hypothetical protein